MTDFPLIVSYYTKDTMYQLEVQNLIASCEQWGVEYLVEPIASFGSWESNCCYKPFFLMQKLEQLKRPLFWVDADAVLVRQPEFLDLFNLDFVVRSNAYLDDLHDSKVMSGSLFVNATAGGAQVLKLWGKACLAAFSNPAREEEIWDQIVLRQVLQAGVLGATIGALPVEYLAIVGYAEDEAVVRNPVICHHQASRRFKKIINNAL